jgi:hypothetical protein
MRATLEARQAALDPALLAQIATLSEKLRAFASQQKAAAPVPMKGLVRLGKKTPDGDIVRV